MRKIFLVFLSIFLWTLCGCSKEKTKVKNIEENTEAIEIQSTQAPEMSKTEEAIEEEALALNGKVILIDPGHGINSSDRKEPVAPGSSEMKSAFVSGTAGENQTEEELNLAVGMKLCKSLLELGAETFMTRETHECDVSNVGRAEMGNSLGADLVIRIHADGNNNSSVKGASMLVPSAKYVSETVYSESKVAGNIIFEEFINSTGAKKRGVVERSDMTGFNWSEVPVVLIEMGFMSNPDEDALMETDDYQYKIVDGITQGVLKYFEEK